MVGHTKWSDVKERMNEKASARPSWDEYFLRLAQAASLRADCTRRKVGAVIVDPLNRVISVGYNGAPPGELGCLSGGCPRGKLSQEELPSGTDGYDNCISCHAEANALLYSDPTRRFGGTLYCTDDPCRDCAKLICASGIHWLCTPSGRAYVGPRLPE